MNKLYILIIAIALFAGCSKKNDTAPAATSIVGKWDITADTDRVYLDGTLNQTTILNESYSPYVQFNQDGSGVLMDDATGATIKFTYTVSDQTITFNYPAQIISGVQVAAFTRTATFNQYASGKMEIIFNTTVIDGGDTERDFEVVYVVA